MYPGSVYGVLASEKCVLRERFISPSHTARNGWTLVGAPTVFNGLHLDGTTQRATKVPINEFNSPGITLAFRFTPDFNWDEDAVRVMVDCTNGSRYTIFKHNNGSNNYMGIYLGNANIANIASATYSPFWKQSELNTLVVAGISGNTNVWLNGNQILSADPTAWTPKAPATLYIGTTYLIAGFFDGIIHSSEIFQEAWDAAQEANWRNNSTFSSLGQADCLLNMKTQEGTGIVGDETRTPDRSGHGRDFLVGDGVTPATMPTFVNPGYDFDGGTDYMKLANAAGVYNNSQQTIIFCFAPDFWTRDVGQYYLYDSTDGSRYMATKMPAGSANKLRIIMGNTTIVDVLEATYSPYWRVSEKNVLVVSSESADTNVWLNTAKIADGVATAWTPDDPAEIFLGTYYGALSAFFLGKIYYYAASPFLFSDTMVREISARLIHGAA